MLNWLNLDVTILRCDYKFPEVVNFQNYCFSAQQIIDCDSVWFLDVFPDKKET